MIIYLLHEGLSMYRMFVFREAFKGYIKVKIPFRTYASCKREFQTLLTFFACHRLWTYMAYNTKSTVGANGFKFSCTCNSCPDSCLNNGKLCIPSALLPGCPIVMEGESVHLFQLVLFILKKQTTQKSSNTAFTYLTMLLSLLSKNFTFPPNRWCPASCGLYKGCPTDLIKYQLINYQTGKRNSAINHYKTHPPSCSFVSLSGPHPQSGEQMIRSESSSAHNRLWWCGNKLTHGEIVWRRSIENQNAVTGDNVTRCRHFMLQKWELISSVSLLCKSKEIVGFNRPTKNL